MTQEKGIKAWHLKHKGHYVRASNNAIALIKKFEQLRLQAYQDSGGKWTVGWGTVGPGITERTTVSTGVANGMLIGDVSRIGQDISQMVGINVNQNAFDALVSLVYNIGITAFRNSTMLKLIQQHKLEAAADEFDRWTHVDGKEIEGLKIRREAEKALFLSKTPG